MAKKLGTYVAVYASTAMIEDFIGDIPEIDLEDSLDKFIQQLKRRLKSKLQGLIGVVVLKKEGSNGEHFRIMETYSINQSASGTLDKPAFEDLVEEIIVDVLTDRDGYRVFKMSLKPNK